MTEGRIFDAEPHPDERVEWLRAQVEAFATRSDGPVSDKDVASLVEFVKWMEKRFMPRGFLSR